MTTPQTNDTGTPKELAIEYLRKNARYQNRAIDYESPTYKEFMDCIDLAIAAAVAAERERILIEVNSHGAYQSCPEDHYDRLEEIKIKILSGDGE